MKYIQKLEIIVVKYQRHRRENGKNGLRFPMSNWEDGPFSKIELEDKRGWDELEIPVGPVDEMSERSEEYKLEAQEKDLE